MSGTEKQRVEDAGTHDFFGPEDGELQVVDPLAGHRGSRAEARLVLHGE